ncbi:dehydration-responsive element-binding protein 1f-like [Trifolium pratense]|uniref:Dehydration-responsive element-binding protein 1f-like n=1 Tax=Trifolium pratense TaxID=57577 RepID=A0A2K3LWE6_TRIPR|nr:dehydration-responsive element-binding protein 1F-like [Trifolium pratense]PNX82854.1 dehydration-responsive element-binding protein 1f-like [Trifolium pratense]
MNKRRAGRKKFHETRHPIYKGVRQRNGKWVCEIRQPSNKTRVWLGTFSHPDMAAIAYDVAALAFKGEDASLNFPHSASSLPRLNSRTSSIRSIQFAATKAAEKHFSSCQDSEPFFAEITKNDSESSLEKSFSESFFWDEEEVFNMPGLINSMAEGLLITPPALQRGFNWVDGDTTMDLSLWEN